MVAAAVMGVATIGGAAMGASANKKAANTASDSARYAADQNAALVREQMARSDQYTAGLTGYAGMGASALASRLGLSPRNALASGSAPVANNALTAGMDARAPGLRSSGLPDARAGVPLTAMAPQPDYAAYGQQNPAVMAWAQNAVGLVGYDGQRINSVEDALAYHYREHGSKEGRELPMTQPQGQATTPQPAPMPTGQPEGYQPRYYGDTGGADMPTFGPRPELGARPDIGPAPNPSDYFNNFEESDYYRWVQDETRRATNIEQAARGLGSSGGTLKALQDRSSRVASGYRDNWFTQQRVLYESALGQYNADRSFLNSLYDIDATRADARFDADRNFGYGRAVDNRNFLAGRFDTETANIFGLAGIGTGAINTALGQGQAATNALMAGNNQVADATGNAALVGASNTNALFGQSLNALGNFYGNRNQSGNALGGFLGSNNSLKGLY